VPASRSSGDKSGSRAKDLTRRLDRAGRDIQDPVAKLKYIRGSIDRARRADLRIRLIPFEPVRRALYKAYGLDELRDLLEVNPMGVGPASRAVRRVERVRKVVAGGVVTAAALTALVAVVSLARVKAPAAEVEAASGTTTAALPASAAPQVAGVAPSGVWLVETGAGWEQYSNGLRVETAWSVTGEGRRFRVFTEQNGAEGPARHEPVGILFHTTESDIWPLEAAYNESLRDSSQKLLAYVARKRLYHYLIDRFGRVYRLVEEATKANHAGHSVWAQGNQVYVNLNHAFLGVAFETRWEGGRALPITQAQFAAGRNLTDYLRQRWRIAPEMCVAHGLASINPRKRLIGHHLDWARGFPFEAFGLPDQYNRLAPSVAVFGYGYDEDFLKILGEPWTGVRDAERMLSEEASRQGRTVDEVRSQRQRLYDQWVAEQARDEADGAASRAQQWPASNESGG
jgi:hypothetical protein